MKAVRTLIFTCISVPLATLAHRTQASPSNAPAAPSLSDQIDHLGDRGTSARSAAYESLRLCADPNLRAALLEAAHRSPDPQVRERAAKLLCNLPWNQPGDPEQLQSVLRNYRTPSVEQRIGVLGQLAAARQAAVPVLIRLLQEDPSDDVRWAIVATLNTIGDAADDLRKLNPAADDAPALAAAGWGWLETDPDKSAQYFRQSVAVASAQGADDHGEIEQMLDRLISRALNRGEYADAIEFSRQQIWYSESPADETVPYFFAQYAQHGLQASFQQDARTFAAFFRQPEMMYVLGKIFAAQGQQLAANACFASAWQATTTLYARERAAVFLLKVGWHEMARAHLRQLLVDGASDPTVLAWVYPKLGVCDNALDDVLQAAGDFDRAQQLFHAVGVADAEPLSRRFAAMADWCRLRDATRKDDHARVAQLADKLFRSDAWKAQEFAAELDLDIDLVRALKSLDRKPDALQVFNSAYGQMQNLPPPHDANWMNNVAWLCARSGERLEEAYRKSHEAIRLAPANAANLDTAAETAAALGKWDEAADLEAAALKLQPGDKFMTAQFHRFKAKGK